MEAKVSVTTESEVDLNKSYNQTRKDTIYTSFFVSQKRMVSVTRFNRLEGLCRVATMQCLDTLCSSD